MPRHRSRSRSRSRSPIEGRYRDRRRSPDRDEFGRSRRRSRDSSSDRRKRISPDSRSRSVSRSPTRSRSVSRSPSPSHRHRSSGSSKKHKHDKHRHKDKKKKKKTKDKREDETEEEKRARREARREEKLRKQMEKEGVKVGGYTNLDNPFNDANLSEKFVWHKKFETAEEQGLSKKELKRIERERRREHEREIETMRRRREQREQELKAMEAERDAMLRMQDAEQFGEWINQEDEFMLEQARKRSEIRLKEGRAKPIDILAKYTATEMDASELDLNEPYAVFRGLSLDDTEDLCADIKVFMRLEGNDKEHLAFWKDMLLLGEYETRERRLEELRENPNLTPAEQRALDTGVNPAVKAEILRVLHGKTSQQLRQMQSQIQAKLNSGEAIDTSYWETLLQELEVQMAKARLRERHQRILEHKMQLLEKEDLERRMDEMAAGGEAGQEKPSADGSESAAAETEPEPTFAVPAPPRPEATTDNTVEIEMLAPAPSPPVLEEADELKVDDPVYLDEEEAMKLLESLQKDVRLRRRRGEFAVGHAERQPVAETDTDDDGVERVEDEKEFKEEVSIEPSSGEYLWSDKYRPRKPRFFNRVFTGYEWNQYNRHHYDRDNPPPKMVQGYKFNIFYPDLIDPTKPPTFTKTAIKDEPGFAILRFTAGPPYQDIAFKIVDRQWQYGRRSGYRCQFTPKNIFELHFRFKRERYRR